MDLDNLAGAIRSLEDTLRTHSSSLASGGRRLGSSLQDKYHSLLTGLSSPTKELDGRLFQSPTRRTHREVGEARERERVREREREREGEN